MKVKQNFYNKEDVAYESKESEEKIKDCRALGHLAIKTYRYHKIWLSISSFLIICVIGVRLLFFLIIIWVASSTYSNMRQA